jgi:hypothetical protein
MQMNAEHIVGTLIGEGESDDSRLLRDIAKVGMDTPWLAARRAWDNADPPDKAWTAVFNAIGFIGGRADYMAVMLNRLEREARTRGIDFGEMWPQVDLHLSAASIPTDIRDIVHRIWFGMKPGGIRESDDIFTDVARVGASSPYAVARRAWDREISYGSGENPWRAVFFVLGYRNDLAHDIADEFVTAAEDVEQRSQEEGVEPGAAQRYRDETWGQVLEGELALLQMKPAEMDAIHRLWNNLNLGTRREIPESDDIQADVVKAALNSPDAIVRRAWRKGMSAKEATTSDYDLPKNYFGWFEVIKALGHTNSTVALQLARLQKLDVKGRASWMDAYHWLQGIVPTPAYMQALQRLYNGTLSESEEIPEPDEDIMRDISRLAMNPVHAIIDAIKRGISYSRTFPHTGDYTWDLEVKVEKPDMIDQMPDMPRMIIIRAKQYVGDGPVSQAAVGGYFWMKADWADALKTPLTSLIKAAGRGHLFGNRVMKAYEECTSVRYTRPIKYGKGGRAQKNIYGQGIYAYYR